jgi:hypothetical protein
MGYETYNTLLVKNLPEQITPEDVERFFDNNIRLGKKFKPYVEKVGCIYAAPRETCKSTVVTFSSEKVAREALALNRQREITAEAAAPGLQS